MPLSLEDQLDIMELMARYSHAIDGDDPEGWAATFTDDGIFESSSGTVKGREDMLAFVRWRGDTSPIRVWNNNILIEGDGDDATAKVHLILLDVSGPPMIRTSSLSHDTLKRVDGQWKFTHRKVEPDPRPG